MSCLPFNFYADKVVFCVFLGKVACSDIGLIILCLVLFIQLLSLCLWNDLSLLILMAFILLL